MIVGECSLPSFLVQIKLLRLLLGLLSKLLWQMAYGLLMIVLLRTGTIRIGWLRSRCSSYHVSMWVFLRLLQGIFRGKQFDYFAHYIFDSQGFIFYLGRGKIFPEFESFSLN